ncbi:hypothetical protein F4813DRAFT_383866 [Daldinia decipiens]|uniref:uncharacterized protein n=1 Tax=Daldinia decipiens TaxID=326647 RepID=UPI0020C46629|nr:uncharacterized protein F4813DRAFT_383866 [Daldinia decipiens]KAI1652608.1 hypothetical protein F4813DRAFT_383866 [Daldinia decipiens]
MRIPPSKAGEVRNDGRGHGTHGVSDNNNLKVELDQLSVQTRRFIDVASGLTKNLPPNVRHKIWHLAAGPKLMEIFEIRWRSPIPDTEPRSMVTMDKRRMRVSHACQESRSLLYPSPRCSEWLHTPVQTYMDPDRDSVMINGNFMIGMSFEDILGHVQRLILTPDHGSFQIVEEISLSYGPCWNMQQVSFVLETWSIPAQASTLICERLSARMPVVVDLDDDQEMIRTMNQIVDGPWHSQHHKRVDTLSSFYKQCHITRTKKSYNRMTTCGTRLCDAKYWEGFCTAFRANWYELSHNQRVPDIKRVALLVEGDEGTPKISQHLPWHPKSSSQY